MSTRPELTIVATNTETRTGLKAEFSKLFAEVRTYWVDDDGDGELELLQAVADAADGDIRGTYGLQQQVTWLRRELKTLKELEKND